MKNPKVVLIGAGSAFFGRQTIWSMVMKDCLREGTLALVDTNPAILKTMGQIAKRAIDAKKAPLKLELATDYKDVLPGADFVIMAFAVKGVDLRGVDTDIPGKHGITMCSADTIGPGGIMRTLREVPRQNEMMKHIEKLCPNAWVINWVNPTTTMGIAMSRHFPKIKSMALCDGPHNPYHEDKYIHAAGIVKNPSQITDKIRSQTKIRIGGINHFKWLIELSYQGEDLIPHVLEQLKRDSSNEHHAAAEAGKRTLSAQISYQLAEKSGYIPTCIWHTMEYLPFFQGNDIHKSEALAIKPWSLETRRKWMQTCWDDMEAIASGKRDIHDFLSKTKADHASDIIEDMLLGLKKKWHINTFNQGAVPNMADDAFLELPCTVDLNRVTPLPFGEMPRPLVGWMAHILDEHELSVEAALTCDRSTLRKAFLSSMLTRSIPDTDLLMEELLQSQKDFLPSKWFSTNTYNENSKKQQLMPQFS